VGAAKKSGSRRRVKAHLDDSSMLFLAKIYKGSCYDWFRCLLDMLLLKLERYFFRYSNCQVIYQQ
jgi:hypothetical protein